MQIDTSATEHDCRLTRRGRVALVATGAVVAAAAVTVPLLTLTTKDEETRPTSLVIPEGWRTGQVYEAIDEALALPLGSTKKSLAKANLRSTYAEGNPEGYLYPATYHIDKTATPESLLALMVNTANKKFSGSPITAGAQRNAMKKPVSAITIASVIQAETSTKADIGEVAGSSSTALSGACRCRWTRPSTTR